MKSVNLIPAPRLIAKQRRIHVRRCAVMCSVWALMCCAATGVAHLMYRSEDPQSADRLAQAAEDIERTDRAIGTVKLQLAAAQSTLRANEAIASQPDWSVLLAVLAKKVGNDVVLKSCHVHPVGSHAGARRAESRRPAAPATPAGGAAEGVPFVLEASGMARSHAAANRFVLDLEETKLFARVTLLDTAREPFLVGEAIAFRLECSLEEPAPSAVAPVTAAPAARAGAQAAVDRR